MKGMVGAVHILLSALCVISITISIIVLVEFGDNPVIAVGAGLLILLSGIAITKAYETR